MDDHVAEFHRLHSSGCFVMPNPWDLGTARALERLGFKALATTSAGLAWTLGRPDGQVTLDEALEHLRQIAGAVTVPVNADFENGYAVEPAQVAENVKKAADTGIAGLSIEDSSGDAAVPLYEFDLAVERIAAARQAVDETGTGVLLTARAWDQLDHVTAIVAAVSPKPVNLLVNAPITTVTEAAELGVRRISVGGSLGRAAWGGWLKAIQEIADEGTFAAFAELPDVDGMLGS